MDEPFALILLPRLRVQNANAVSGPFSWGFPSPTAFLGFVHAIERRIAENKNVEFEGFGGVGIVCHNFEPQIYQPSQWIPGVFCLTRREKFIKRDPVDKKKYIGKAPSFVEEGRAHMEISLLIAVHGFMTENEGVRFAQDIMQAALGMRLAGGSILPVRNGKRFEAQWWPLAEDLESQEKQFQKLRRRLLPGFALVLREDRLAEHLDEMRKKKPDTNALDALMDLSRINWEPGEPNPDDPEKTEWNIRQKTGLAGAVARRLRGAVGSP